jgi:hypothetical protein
MDPDKETTKNINFREEIYHKYGWKDIYGYVYKNTKLCMRQLEINKAHLV